MSNNGAPSRPRTPHRSTEIYVSLARRNRPASVTSSGTSSPTTEPLDDSSSTPIRKGRGLFRADWGTETTEAVESRVPQGRSFDATSLRRYDKESPTGPLRTAQPFSSEPRSRGRDEPDQNLTETLFRRMEILSQRMAALEIPATVKQSVQVSSKVVTNQNDQLSDGSGERNDDSEGDPTFPPSGLADSSTAEVEGDYWVDEENASPEITFLKKGRKNAGTPKRTRASAILADDYPIDEPTTSLQVYDFPPAFRTHHIHEIFAEYEDLPRGGFRIHWVDDTTCILEFRSAGIAKRAYLEKSNHKMVKIKPYTKRLPVNENHPDRKLRPVTTDVVVRRLVQGALGIRKNARTDETPKDAALDPLRLAKAHRQAEREKKKHRDEELEKAFLEK